MFLGIYDYTVILTYISLGISVFGITRALEGDFKVAIFCLALSGLCDMFDGKIARTKKNRTDDEKNFGIQIDSLCDVVCFGIFPAMICYCLGVNTSAGIGALIFYSVACKKTSESGTYPAGCSRGTCTCEDVPFDIK